MGIRIGYSKVNIQRVADLAAPAFSLRIACSITPVGVSSAAVSSANAPICHVYTAAAVPILNIAMRLDRRSFLVMA